MPISCLILRSLNEGSTELGFFADVVFLLLSFVAALLKSCAVKSLRCHMQACCGINRARSTDDKIRTRMLKSKGG